MTTPFTTTTGTGSTNNGASATTSSSYVRNNVSNHRNDNNTNDGNSRITSMTEIELKIRSKTDALDSIGKLRKFVRHALSEQGRNELRQLSQTDASKLWHMLFRNHTSNRYVKGLDLMRQYQDPDVKYEVERILQSIVKVMIHEIPITKEALSLDHVLTLVRNFDIQLSRWPKDLLSIVFSSMAESKEWCSLYHQLLAASWHKDLDGRPSLHVICAKKGDWGKKKQAIMAFLQSHPEVTKIKDTNGYLPFQLHLRSYYDYAQHAFPYLDGLPYFSEGEPHVKHFFHTLELLYDANPMVISSEMYYNTNSTDNTEIGRRGHCYEYSLHRICSSPKYALFPDLFLYVYNKHSQGVFQEDSHGLIPFQVIPPSIERESTVLSKKINKYLNKIWRTIQTEGKGSSSNTTPYISFFNLRDHRNGNNIIHALMKRDFRPNAAVAVEDNMNHRFQLEQTKNILERMMSDYPQLLMEPNNDGDLPIHVFLKNNDSDFFDYAEFCSLVTAYDKECIKQDITNPIDVPVLFHSAIDDIPFVFAASGTQPSLSITYDLVTRYIALNGSFQKKDDL